MKKLFLILIIFSGCAKDEPEQPVCKTCEVNVTHTRYDAAGSVTDKYIESSTEYCDGKWTNVDGNYSYWKLSLIHI